MRKSRFDTSMLKQRRAELAKQLQGGALIMLATPEAIRNSDVHHSYRACSNMVYFTGFEEPEAIFIFRPGYQPESILFVRPKDVERETWDGFRFGPEGAVQEFGIDAAYPIDEFLHHAPELLKPVEKVFYRLNGRHHLEPQVFDVLEEVRKSHGRSGKGLLPIIDPEEFIGNLRLIKSPFEIEQLQKACDIASEAHIATMRKVRPGLNEREVQGFLNYQFLKRGADREGYGTIVAGGNNATTLHYVFNDRECKAGDLLLIDAGAEYNYYTSDITRTFPINGKFTDAQAEVYERVLRVQKQIIDMVRPGLAFEELQNTTISLLTDAMLELGLLTGNKETLIQEKAFRRYYPHGVSHWLGMDVHDVGSYKQNGQARRLVEGMVFTVEPGLYIPFNDEKAPAEYRGIGIRIEDNILVEGKGCRNLTAKAPKEMSDLEALIGKSE